MHTLELSEEQRAALVRGRDPRPAAMPRERCAALLKVAGSSRPGRWRWAGWGGGAS
ncbi:MAG: hypothetical protein U0232_01230 [Thermomicrobiales bacterium]